jgi:hypothetical protein
MKPFLTQKDGFVVQSDRSKMKVFYGQRTFSEFPEKDKERQRST